MAILERLWRPISDRLLGEWFTSHAERHCSPKTVERYRELAAYVLPHIGTVKLNELTTLMLQRVFNEVKDSGGRNRKTKEARPLSPKTVKNISSVIHSALETAVEWSLIRTNPCTRKIVPKLKRKEANALDAEQISWYVNAARAHGLYEFLMVNAGTGCRRGELLALTWGDVDFEGKTLRISKSLEQTKAGLRVKSTKTDKPRPISLSLSTLEVLTSLQSDQARIRDHVGAAYRRDLDLVFCNPLGEYLKPDSVSAKAGLIAKKLGLKNSSLHTLRHSHGSLLLAKGVPLTVVSKRLGHSSTFVTATVYSHAMPKDEIAAADTWDSVVRTQTETDSTRQPS